MSSIGIVFWALSRTPVENLLGDREVGRVSVESNMSSRAVSVSSACLATAVGRVEAEVAGEKCRCREIGALGISRSLRKMNACLHSGETSPERLSEPRLGLPVTDVARRGWARITTASKLAARGKTA